MSRSEPAGVTATPPVGVLLMAYGGPLSLEDVGPYLLQVRGGRPTPPALVEEVRERYRLIGGRSPLLEHTLAQARALENCLNGRKATTVRTFVGMRHWHPYIHEVIPEVVAAGVRRLVAIPMAPHYSAMSVGAYRKALDEAMARVPNPPPVAFVERWGNHPGFIAAVAEKVEAALARFPAPRAEVVTLFTAHSLPRRILATGDPYPDELQESARLVAQRAGLSRWHLAYQSAGHSPEPWLGPDVADFLADLAREGARHVLVVPVGFVCDHVEVLYDIDIELQRVAGALGVHLERTESLNDAPLLIEALSDLVRQALAQERLWQAENAA